MEEQRRTQEAEMGQGSTNETNQTNTAVPGNAHPAHFNHETMKFISETNNNEMDVTRLTEDEQIALAIQMSMSQAESARM